ncbi:MAG: hypothetical protein AAGI17_05730 [Planctomycetota bacterium]
MHVYYAQSLERNVPRSHPWTHAESDATEQYVDFRARPELIRTELEDFVPLGNDPAAERFFELIEWLNGDESVLETNDAAFADLTPNPDRDRVPFAMRASGRVHLFMRELRHNIGFAGAVSITNALGHHLGRTDDGWRDGRVGLARLPVHFAQIEDAENRLGWLHEIHLFSYGNSEREVLDAFARCTRNVRVACEALSRELAAAMAAAPDA